MRDIKWDKRSLIKAFADLETKLGRQPSKKDWIADDSTPSDMPIREQFGNWRNMLSEIGRKQLPNFLPTINGHTRKGVRNKSRERIVNKQGYIKVFEPEHPTAMKNGYCLEHRLAAWDAGILTDLNDVVHHKNGDKQDNDPSNLEAMPNADHTSHHFEGQPNTRQGSVKCSQDNCETLTASKYGLCQKHYRQRWGMVKNGTLSSIHEHPTLITREES